ncbi:glycoside hydrolase family protein [Portibacter lacus]|uniref:glycoside hydrolase family protein n=1 Tax=Portibacter lacus TaxID=1099794 RepID=UPI001F2945FB|nr:glycoside hydrolase family protein [Portibacter lacus]
MKIYYFSYFMMIWLLCSCKSILYVVPSPLKGQVVDQLESKMLVSPSVLDIDGYFVWGGSVVKGKDGKYHMLFSLWESGMEDGSFVKNWVLESKIGYAVSDFPDKDFEFKQIVLKGALHDGNEAAWDAQMVHNPHLKEFNGNYYLYYIGGRDYGQEPVGSTGENLNKRSRVQQSLCTGVIEFNSFEDLLVGRFERPSAPLLEPRTRVKPNNILNGSPAGTVAKPDNIIVVNPSVDYNPKTKEYFLFFKGNLYEPHWKGAHGVALGKSPLGPFVPRDEFIFDVRMPDGTIASTEDPYVWYAKKYKQFYAVVKDFSGQLTGYKKTLALLTSKDGIQWELAENPLFMKRELPLSDGQILEVDRLERPQLLIDHRGVPTVMYAATSIGNVNPKNDGSSFNVQISLIKK